MNDIDFSSSTLDALLSDLPTLAQAEPPSIWPLAPAWWLIAILLALGLTLLVLWLEKQKKTATLRYYRDEAKAAINAAWKKHQLENEAKQYIISANSTLKCYVLCSFPELSISHLSGLTWLNALDELTSTQYFTQTSPNPLSQQYKRNILLNETELEKTHHNIITWLDISYTYARARK